MTWNNAWKAFNKKEAFAPECKERGSKYPHKLSELSEDGRAIVGVDAQFLNGGTVQTYFWRRENGRHCLQITAEPRRLWAKIYVEVQGHF